MNGEVVPMPIPWMVRISVRRSQSWVATCSSRLRTSSLFHLNEIFKSGHTYLCAGGLIGSRFVLTAAHCLQILYGKMGKDDVGKKKIM